MSTEHALSIIAQHMYELVLNLDYTLLLVTQILLRMDVHEALRCKLFRLEPSKWKISAVCSIHPQHPERYHSMLLVSARNLRMRAVLAFSICCQTQHGSVTLEFTASLVILPKSLWVGEKTVSTPRNSQQCDSKCLKQWRLGGPLPCQISLEDCPIRSLA